MSIWVILIVIIHNSTELTITAMVFQVFHAQFVSSSFITGSAKMQHFGNQNSHTAFKLFFTNDFFFHNDLVLKNFRLNLTSECKLQNAVTVFQ